MCWFNNLLVFFLQISALIIALNKGGNFLRSKVNVIKSISHVTFVIMTNTVKRRSITGTGLTRRLSSAKQKIVTNEIRLETFLCYVAFVHERKFAIKA